MSHLAVRTAFALATVAFIWSSDPILGLVLAICALVWAVMPMIPPQGEPRARLRDRLHVE